MALVENPQREGLIPLKALAYQGLMDTYKQTQEMISARLRAVAVLILLIWFVFKIM